MMKHVIKFLLVFAVIGSGFFFLSQHPTDLSFTWSHYQVKTTTFFLFFVILFFFLGLFLTFHLFATALSFPRKMMRWAGFCSQKSSAENLFIQILEMLESENFKEADKKLVRAEKKFKNLPYWPYLRLQKSRQEKNVENEQTALQQLSVFECTPFFKEKNRILHELNKKNNKEALSLLNFLHPPIQQSPWALRQLFSLYIQEKNISAARLCLQKRKKSHFTSEEMRKNQCVLFYTEALFSQTDPSKKEILLSKAAGLDPSFFPVVTERAKNLQNQGKIKNAENILMAAWKLNPHPDLAKMFFSLKPDEMPIQKIQRIQKLIASDPQSPVSHFILAVAFMKAQLWGPAQDQLNLLLQEKPRWAYPLLAVIEQRQKEDWKAACKWLEKGYEEEKQVYIDLI